GAWAVWVTVPKSKPESVSDDDLFVRKGMRFARKPTLPSDEPKKNPHPFRAIDRLVAEVPGSDNASNIGGLADEAVDEKIKDLIRRNSEVSELKDKVTEIIYRDGRLEEYEIIYDENDPLNINNKNREPIREIQGQKRGNILRAFAKAGILPDEVRLGIVPLTEAAIIKGKTIEDSSIIHAGEVRIWLPRDLAEYIFENPMDEEGNLLADIFGHERKHQLNPRVDIHARDPDEYRGLIKRVQKSIIKSQIDAIVNSRFAPSQDVRDSILEKIKPPKNILIFGTNSSAINRNVIDPIRQRFGEEVKIEFVNDFYQALIKIRDNGYDLVLIAEGIGRQEGIISGSVRDIEIMPGTRDTKIRADQEEGDYL
ncbi:MAG: hypothetical protein AAB267_03020, partial [Candidatus Desantisbacteria bacterium]